MARRRRAKQKKGFPKPLACLLVVTVMAGISFAAAWTWQSAQEQEQSVVVENVQASPTEVRESTSIELSMPEPVPIVLQEPSTESSGGEEEVAGQNTKDGGPEADAAKAEEPGEAPEAIAQRQERPAYAGALAQSERVDNSYFDDAIFLGDSISVGIPLYKVMPNAKVVAVQGATPVNVSIKKQISTPDGEVTLLEAAANYGEMKKVYIMLGSNGLADDQEKMIGGYREFLKLVKEQYPGAVIYLQSILPVTEHAKEKYPYSDNDTIDKYNLAILALAREQGVHYLDVASALVDEEGKLPIEYSPLDGVHMTAEAYAIWFEYLRTHTAR